MMTVKTVLLTADGSLQQADDVTRCGDLLVNQQHPEE
jgi:hypothetical protein